MPPPVSQELPDLTTKDPKVRRSSQIIWLPVWTNHAGNPMVNSAGFLPVMPLYEPVAIAVYHITKFKAYSDSEYKAEINALNSTGWEGFDAYQAWISEIHTEGTETYGEVAGEMVHYVVRCIDREDGWRVIIPDCGYVYKDGSTIKSFASESGTPYIGNLDGSGGETAIMSIIGMVTKKAINFSSVDGL